MVKAMKNHEKKSFAKGVTLMEVILASVLMGMVGLALAGVHGAAHSFLLQSTGMATAQGEASYASLHMKRYLSMANEILLYSPTSVAVRYDHRSITGLTATPLDPADDEWDWYMWDVATGNLYYEEDFVPGPAAAPAEPSDFTGTEIIARDVIALTFTLVSPAELDIDLTVQKFAGQETRESTMRSSVTPRGIATN